jgi:hypothetical protein
VTIGDGGFVPAVGADVVGRTVEEGRVGALVGPERVEDKYFNMILYESDLLFKI